MLYVVHMLTPLPGESMAPNTMALGASGRSFGDSAELLREDRDP